MNTSKKCTTAGALLVTILTWGCAASAGEIFFNGFETDNSGWDAFGGSFDATRVASGTSGVTSATGGFHAQELQVDRWR